MPELRTRNWLRLAMPAVLACSLALSVSTSVSWAVPASSVNNDSTVPLSFTDRSVSYEEEGALSHELKLPLYHWWRPNASSRGTVVAVHGLVMHGRSFDVLGRTLAAQGFDVYAIDMRGYGRSMAEDHRYCVSESDCKHRIDYERSYSDLVALTCRLRKQSPRTPLFAVGESLGGAMVIRLSAQSPELVDGLILSSPAIKRQNFLDPYLMANAALSATNPTAQMDLMPFVRKFASDDPRVIAEKEVDPLLRHHLNAVELMRSCNVMRKTVTYIPEIPAETPVLVIQGSADRCIKADAIMLLLANLRSEDQTVKWFHERGHILLETNFVKPDTMDAVVSWLSGHVASGLVQAKMQRRFPEVAVTSADTSSSKPAKTALTQKTELMIQANELQVVGLR
jgi:acylglycerol lipase